jgi:hypothetical protein
MLCRNRQNFQMICLWTHQKGPLMPSYENQLPSGNSMGSQNVLKDHLHMPLLISEKIENQLPSGNSLLIDQKASRVPFDG